MITDRETEAVLAKAVLILQGLPHGSPEAVEALGEKMIEGLPEIVAEVWAERTRLQAHPPTHVPEPEDVHDLGVVFGWLHHIPPLEQQVVWLRAAGTRWAVIRDRLQVQRHRLFAIHSAGIAYIVHHRRKEAKASASPKPTTAGGGGGKGKGGGAGG